MDVQLPDGTVIQGVPDGTTKAELAQKLQSKGMQVPSDWLKPAEAPKPPTARELTAPGPIHGAIESSVGEPAAQAITGIASTAAGGIAGLARGAGAGAAALASGKSPGASLDVGAQEFTDTLHVVQEAGTYQPRSDTGKAVSGAISKPFTWLAGKGTQAGTAVGGATERLARTAGASPETARRLGGGAAALTETAVQAAPAAVAPLAGRVGRSLSADESTLAARSAQVGEVPRGTPAKPQTPGPTPEARAQAYANRIGLDWSRLGAGTRAALTQIARDGALDRLDPQAVARRAHLEGLRVPVPATRGQLTRDPVQLRREAVASNLPEGQPIRDVDVGANQALQANLEALRGRAGGQRGGLHEPVTPEGQPAAEPSLRAPTKLPTQVGSSVQTALRSSEKASKARYDALYKRARETEPMAKVAATPLTDLLGSNPDIQHLGFVSGWLNRAAKARGVVEGQPYTPQEFTLSELHDLRSQATKIARTGGVQGHYAGEVVKAIDGMMEGAPEAAKAWKAANAAFRGHKAEFAEQSLVRDLVSQKKGTAADRRTALEDTWKNVVQGSSREQLLTVKKSLMKAGRAGRQAWNDLRAETVNRILEDARGVAARDETERAVLTEAALRRSISRIPRENLREVLGANLLRELDSIVRARSITTRGTVGGRATQSGTVPNAMVMKVANLLEHIPGAKYAIGAAKGIKKLGEIGETERTVRRATQVRMEDLQRGGGTLPETIGAIQP